MDLVYKDRLMQEGLVSEADIKGWEKEYTDTLNKHFELAKKITKLSIMDWIDTPWTGFFEATDPKKVWKTKLDFKILELAFDPEGEFVWLVPHPSQRSIKILFFF